MTDPPRSFLALDASAAEAAVVAAGGRAFHARIIRREVMERGVLEYAEMTSLPLGLRDHLANHLPLISAREVRRSHARDKTTKLLIEMPDGARVETVHMPRLKQGTGGATLCVSTQVGCPVACPFCASGLDGLQRNLEAHEIVEQFLLGRAIGPLARAVVMGIGEPLLNLEALNRALDVVHDELNIGARRVTVSTVGFPERLKRAARSRPRFQLAISLHSPFDAERDRLVPAMAGVPIEEVLEAGDDWFEVTGRNITYECVLLGGFNDTPAHARRLAERLTGRRAHVNLIPYNPSAAVEQSAAVAQNAAVERPWQRPEARSAEQFRDALTAAGLTATLRWSRGLESDAACGQLRTGAAGTA